MGGWGRAGRGGGGGVLKAERPVSRRGREVGVRGLGVAGQEWGGVGGTDGTDLPAGGVGGRAGAWGV